MPLEVAQRMNVQRATALQSFWDIAKPDAGAKPIEKDQEKRWNALIFVLDQTKSLGNGSELNVRPGIFIIFSQLNLILNYRYRGLIGFSRLLTQRSTYQTSNFTSPSPRCSCFITFRLLNLDAVVAAKDHELFLTVAYQNSSHGSEAIPLFSNIWWVGSSWFISHSWIIHRRAELERAHLSGRSIIHHLRH
jgi:hypothetical protein